MEQNIHVGAVAAADMSGEDVRWVSSDPVVRGAQDPPAAVRVGPERTACRATVPGEISCGAGWSHHHNHSIEEALPRHAEEILR